MTLRMHPPVRTQHREGDLACPLCEQMQRADDLQATLTAAVQERERFRVERDAAQAGERRAERERDEYREAIEKAGPLRLELEASDALLSRYREALEFYGEDSNWTFNELTESNRDERSLVDRDLGALARQVLSDPSPTKDQE